MKNNYNLNKFDYELNKNSFKHAKTITQVFLNSEAKDTIDSELQMFQTDDIEAVYYINKYQSPILVQCDSDNNTLFYHRDGLEVVKHKVITEKSKRKPLPLGWG